MANENVNKVSITDLDMPFLSMVRFMVKWAIAAIPAMLILLILGAVFWGLLLGFFIGIGSGLSHRSLSAASLPSVDQKEKEHAPSAKPKEPDAVSVTLLKKGFRARDWESGSYQDAITFAVAFKNLTGKDVRAFDGILTFSDLLGNEILSSHLAINDPLKAGATVNWSGQLDYNQFMDSHVRLRGEDQPNLKLSFRPRKVLFADGATKEYE